jgi:hypothetical protein
MTRLSDRDARPNPETEPERFADWALSMLVRYHGEEKARQLLAKRGRALIEKYGAAALKNEIGGLVEPKIGGRPKDPRIFNEAIIAGHVEFLKLHRVGTKTKKVDSACAELESTLKRSTAAARQRTSGTLKKLYKTVRTRSKSDPLTASVMDTTYAQLVRELANHPNKIGIPYLVEGTAHGEKFPIFDLETLGCTDIAPIICVGNGFRACVTVIATLKN